MRYKYDIYRLFFGISAVPVWYKYGISNKCGICAVILYAVDMNYEVHVLTYADPIAS